MNPGGNPANLVPPWKPGQPGNPKGSSKKARARKYLRDFLQAKLAEQADPEVIKEIIGGTVVDLDDMEPEQALEHMRQLLTDGLSKGEVIAHRMVEDAMGSGPQAAVARSQIIATEPKTIEVEQPDPVSPQFVPTEGEQAAIEQAARAGEMVH